MNVLVMSSIRYKKQSEPLQALYTLYKTIQCGILQETNPLSLEYKKIIPVTSCSFCVLDCLHWVLTDHLPIFVVLTFVLFFSHPSLSSGPDHAVCRRDERCHQTRRDNPVAVHSGWLKGLAKHIFI